MVRTVGIYGASEDWWGIFCLPFPQNGKSLLTTGRFDPGAGDVAAEARCLHTTLLDFQSLHMCFPFPALSLQHASQILAVHSLLWSFLVRGTSTRSL